MYKIVDYITLCGGKLPPTEEQTNISKIFNTCNMCGGPTEDYRKCLFVIDSIHPWITKARVCSEECANAYILTKLLFGNENK